MDDKLLLALVAAGSAILGGVLTGVISPWIKHRLEQSVEHSARQRELLQKWRAMVLEVAHECDINNNGNVSEVLQLHPDYLSLEPLLSEETRKSIYCRNFVVTLGQSLPYELEIVKNAIANIEKEWGLR